MPAMVAARTHLWTPSAGPCSTGFTGYPLRRSIKNVGTHLYMYKTGRKGRTQALVTQAEIKFVDGEDAKKLVSQEGYNVLDVRDQSQYDRAHISQSVHIPFFTLNNDNDVGTTLKRAMHNGFAGMIYGVAFTKPNPDFLTEVQKRFSKDSKLLLVCQEGMRAGTAAKLLEEVGYEKLACMDSGLQKVKPDLFPSEGPKQLQDAGKGGFITIQSQVSAVLATILISAYLFVTLFPTQAEELFFKN